MANVKLTTEVLDVLERSTMTADSLKLPEQLDRDLYNAVNKAIVAAGGKWNRSRQCHIFAGDPRAKLGLALESGVVIDEKKKYQAFYTPRSTAESILSRIVITGKRVLEPSAGGGAFADLIRLRAAETVCVELNPEAADALRMKGHTVFEGDFLSKTTRELGGLFDVVVMNPPFSGDQDVDHVRHAYSMLKPGGELFAIISPRFQFIDRHKWFRELIQTDGVVRYELPEGTFAESGTNIRTVVISLSNSMTASIPKPTPAPQGQRLDGVNLQEILDSAKNAGDLGRQQFVTPPEAAAAFCTPLPMHRKIFVDLTMGAGGLLIGARPEFAIGVDIDPRCARKPANAEGDWHCAAADLTKLYPLLHEIDWKFDLCGLNPPFSLQWHKDRLVALLQSDCDAVADTFAACQGKHIDSTLATFLIALDRMTDRGEGYLICNEATAIRLFGHPDGAGNEDRGQRTEDRSGGWRAQRDARFAQPSALGPRSSVISHVWLWLTVPPGLFEGVRDFNTAVIYFARGHTSGSPLHLTAPDAYPETLFNTLLPIQRKRPTLREGLGIWHETDFRPDTVARFKIAKDEYYRARSAELGTRKAEYNLWLEEGFIRRHLTPFQEFSGRIPKDLIKSLNSTPMALVVQKPSRIALLKALRSEFWAVDPTLIAAVEQAVLEYHANRAPYYPLNDVQRLGFLDEEDAILCKQELCIGNTLAGESTTCFRPGVSYDIQTSTRAIERHDSRPNILGNWESVTYHGQELLIKIKDCHGKFHSFGTFEEKELSAYVHTLEDLVSYFTVPAVADVAIIHAAKYQANLAKLDDLERRMNGHLGGSDGNPRPILPPISTPMEEASASSVVANAQPSSKDTAEKQKAENRKLKFTFREYQRDDLARFTIHEGGIFGWDPGLGKTVAIFALAHIYNIRRGLVVAPEGLHQQIIEEAQTKFGITIKPLMSQADYYTDKDLRAIALARLNEDRGPRTEDRGGLIWRITSYTALGYNGADEWQPKEKENGECIVTPKIQLARELHPRWQKGCDESIGVRHHIGPLSSVLGPQSSVLCLYSPSLATLVADLFDFVACDEAVRLKSTDSYTSLGVRKLTPAYRVVLTGTPIKNHLDDIFWLAHWSAGGHAEACSRWPYENSASAKERFSNEHMLIEENHTKAAKYFETHRVRKTFKRRTPKICNIHRLWKLLGNIVLRRRKDDIGSDIVPKTIIPIRVMPGTAQQTVYKFHCDHPPDFTKDGRPMNVIAKIVAQLQNLRQAALCPDTTNLSSQYIRLCKVREILEREARNAERGMEEMDADGFPINPFSAATIKAIKVARKGVRTPFEAEAAVALEIVQRMIAGNQMIDVDAIMDAAPSLAAKLRPAIIIESNSKSARSWTDHNPKQAAILKLIENLIGQGEQVIVMSPFQHFSQSLYKRLSEAGVSVCLLDGNVSPKKRGQIAAQFKKKRYAVQVAGQKSMGEGNSFECCSHLILPSIEWAYDINRQAEDRVHRLNSPKPVQIYACATTNTVDDRLLNLYHEKGDSSCLALDGRLFADKTDEINIGQLLSEAIRNFDPKADTIDELDIEKEWQESLKQKLRHAEARFREWHPPIVPDMSGHRVTAAEVRAAVAATGGQRAEDRGPTTAVVARLKAIPSATFGALIGTTDRAVIDAVRAAFEAFCTAHPHSDWRHCWAAFDKHRIKRPAPAVTGFPITDRRTQLKALLTAL